MGFLDRAKKLAEQAKDKAEEALAEAKARAAAQQQAKSSQASAPPGPQDPRMGTAYVPGMLGRPGWREKGLTDPAALLPIQDRDRAGVPHSTKSQILEEPFGMGRRWTAGERSLALFYQLYPEHQSWQPPGGAAPSVAISGASEATLPDGRSLVFLSDGGKRVVLEASGFDDTARAQLAHAVAAQLANA
jgi:hypothetical protein